MKNGVALEFEGGFRFDFTRIRESLFHLEGGIETSRGWNPHFWISILGFNFGVGFFIG